MPDEIAQVVEAQKVEAPVQEAPKDLTNEEIATAAREIERTLATTAQARLAALQGVIASEKDTDRKAELEKQLSEEVQQWQTIGAVLPERLRQYQTYLKDVHEKTGVPLRLLTTAKTEADLRNVVGAWTEAHPKVVAKKEEPAKPGEEEGEPESKPVPRKVDSGVNSGASGNEDWRKLSAMDKIRMGLWAP